MTLTTTTAQAKADVVANLSGIAAQHRAEAEASDAFGCICVHTGTGALALTIVNGEFRFGSLVHAKVYSHAVASIHADHWNRSLIDAQREAGCRVRVMRRREVLLANVRAIEEMIASVTVAGA